MIPILPVAIDGLFGIGSKLIDKLFPDPEQKAKAQLELLQMQQSGELDEMRTRLSAILAEANSADPWTSRARPSFLYVVYVLLLMSIPMGVLTIFNPAAAESFTNGFKGWMAAIPEPVLALFGTVMLGYTLSRSYEKKNGIK